MRPNPVDHDLLEALGLGDAYGSHPHRTWDYAIRQTWATPAAFVCGLERIAEVKVDVDLCAEKHTAKAPIWYGPRSPHGVTNTFKDPWPLEPGLAWCNPDFARKAQWADFILKRGVPTWFLVPNTTDQAWFGRLFCHKRAHLHILQGRLAFEPPEGVNESQRRGAVVLWSINFDAPLLPQHLVVRDVLQIGLARDGDL